MKVGVLLIEVVVVFVEAVVVVAAGLEVSQAARVEHRQRFSGKVT